MPAIVPPSHPCLVNFVDRLAPACRQRPDSNPGRPPLDQYRPKRLQQRRPLVNPGPRAAPARGQVLPANGSGTRDELLGLTRAEGPQETPRYSAFPAAKCASLYATRSIFLLFSRTTPTTLSDAPASTGCTRAGGFSAATPSWRRGPANGPPSPPAPPQKSMFLQETRCAPAPNR